VIFPVAESYLNPETKAKELPIYKIAVKLAEKIGNFEIIPIVQSYQLRDDSLTSEEKDKLGKLSYRLSKEYSGEVEKRR